MDKRQDVNDSLSFPQTAVFDIVTTQSFLCMTHDQTCGPGLMTWLNYHSKCFCC